ncbi:MAG: PAS domain-containing sensor histidine kinase [Pseudolabrys sp.]
MTESEVQFAYLQDPRFAAHALNPVPVWLWSAEADRILWANPTGAAIFNAASPGAITTRRFDSQHAAAAQVARLARTLPQGGAPRLERLRGFGTGIGGTLICLCSRITLADNSSAIFLQSTERSGGDIALPERARRLLDDVQLPAAIFTADGELIEAKPAARERFGERRDLVALGAEKLAREATLNGAAEGESKAGHINLLKLGAGSTFVLFVAFVRRTASNRSARKSADKHEPVSATSTPTAPKPAKLDVPQRQLPFRFVWQTDAQTRLTLASQDVVDLLGPTTAAVLCRSWIEIAQSLNLDPLGQIANALTARETFSGIVVSWPVDGTDERLAIEMSGLPVFDREREFKGFRGFGICRDLETIEKIQNRRRPPAASPAAANEPESKVLPFPSPPPEPTLSPRERSAFQELARELSERLKKTSAKTNVAVPDDFSAAAPAPASVQAREQPRSGRDAQESRPILDRLPVGILVYRLNSLLYANRAFLDWTGYSTLDALNEAGGLESLFIESMGGSSSDEVRNGAKSLTIATVNGKQKPVEGRLFSAIWNSENALVLMIDTQIGTQVDSKGGSEVSSGNKPADAAVHRENHELKAILDTATDGVLVLDRAGHIVSANRSAQALFGYEAAEFPDLSMSDLLAPESQRSVLDHLDRLTHGSGAGVLNAGYEAIGRVRQGGLVPLYITIGRIEDGEKLCAVLRDVTAWKRTEEELTNAKRAAEKASNAKSEFLAKISHEIRTPLNAIIGFSEVMMDERFGPVGNDRYRQYLKDIHASGGHLISLLSDLLDLSKIEAGKLELTFLSVNLNDLVQQCVAIMQEQANRERVIIRTSLPATLPHIIADARSMRQIALNLLSNSIKFTGAGGQVIISTALTDDHEVVLRVRDTGTGMSDKELQTALEPFQQVSTAARWDSSGTGLGLPITKALVEANHARFRITSHVDAGTLVEVAFPTSRVLAH